MASQVGNVNHPQYPGLEDFGDVMLRGNGGSGYIRVDWFTPDGLSTWGDGRLDHPGTDGFIEIRKNVDIAAVRAATTCSSWIRRRRATSIPAPALPYGERLVDDVLNRTETRCRRRTSSGRWSWRSGPGPVRQVSLKA